MHIDRCVVTSNVVDDAFRFAESAQVDIKQLHAQRCQLDGTAPPITRGNTPRAVAARSLKRPAQGGDDDGPLKRQCSSFQPFNFVSTRDNRQLTSLKAMRTAGEAQPPDAHSDLDAKTQCVLFRWFSRTKSVPQARALPAAPLPSREPSLLLPSGPWQGQPRPE